MAATPMPSAALLISREHVPLLLEKMKDLVEVSDPLRHLRHSMQYFLLPFTSF